MFWLKERYGVKTAELNDPVVIIERVRSLISWWSREEDRESRQLIRTSAEVLLEHLKQLIQEGGEK